METLTLHRGEALTLPHTLAATRHLTVTLLEADAAAGTATVELHNPDAQPDELVSELVKEHLDDVEESNKWRDKLHIPEKPVPVDTETMAVETLHCSLHEKLQIGDRVWKVTAINDDSVTLTPGHDYEAHSALNSVEDLAYSKEGLAIAKDLGTLDRDL